jgi:hypothetical protein
MPQAEGVNVISQIASRAKSAILFGCCLIGTTGSGPSFAHNLNQTTRVGGEEEARREDATIIKAKLSSELSNAVFSIIRVDQVWTHKSSLTVCFGPADAVTARKDLISQIESIAAEWTSDIPVKFDYGSNKYRVCKSVSSADIRVDISVADTNGPSFQSLIGNDAVGHVIAGHSPYSMQLTFPDKDPYYTLEVVRFYVLHEFGHALGANHEHQRIDCNWDYDYVASHFGFQDASNAKDNLENTFGYDASAYPDIGALSVAGYIGTKYDQYSIMKYNMSTSSSASGDDPLVYQDGVHDKCYRAGWVSKLTDYDKAGIKVAYSNPTGVRALLASMPTGPGAHFLAAPAVARLSSYGATGAPTAGAPAAPVRKRPTPGVVGLRDQIALVQQSPEALAVLSKILAARQ